MRKIVISFFLLSLICSCNQEYCEYDIENKSLQTIFVKIITTGAPYLDTLNFEIPPNESKRVFEHEKYETITRMKSCKFMRDFKITDTYSREIMKNFFCENCSIITESKGVFGRYIIITLQINEQDFNKTFLK